MAMRDLGFAWYWVCKAMEFQGRLVTEPNGATLWFQLSAD